MRDGMDTLWTDKTGVEGEDSDASEDSEGHTCDRGKTEGEWKDLMTRKVVNAIQKYCDLRKEQSQHRFVLTTNHKKQTKAKLKSRRAKHFICSDKYSGPVTNESEAYFKPLLEMDPKTLALYLFSEDLTGFNPRKFETGVADTQQMQRNWTSTQRFLNDVLDCGGITETKGTATRTWYLGGGIREAC